MKIDSAKNESSEFLAKMNPIDMIKKKKFNSPYGRSNNIRIDPIMIKKDHSFSVKFLSFHGILI